MAELYLDGGVYSLTWQITELENLFNSKNYICAGITPYKVEFGSSSLPLNPDGIPWYFDQVEAPNAPNSRSSNETELIEVSCAPGRYIFYGYAQSKNGLYYPAGEAEVVVLSSNPVPVDAEVSYDVTSTSVTFTIDHIHGGQYGYCYVYDKDGYYLWDEDDDRSYFSSPSGVTVGSGDYTKNITLGGLLPGTSYYVNVELYSEGVGTWLEEDDAEIETDDIDPRFIVTLPDGDLGKTSVNISGYNMLSDGKATVYITDLSTNTEIWGAYISGSSITLTNIVFSENFGSLSPGTDYKVGVSFRYEDRVGNYDTWRAKVGDTEDTVAYFKTLLDKLPTWTWVPEISPGKPVCIRADEWNKFTKHINTVRVRKGLSEVNTFTTAVGGVTKIGATICNQARTAIDEINGHGELPLEASKDNPLSANFFNKLMTAINAVP